MAAQNGTQQLIPTNPGNLNQNLHQGEPPHSIVELASYPFQIEVWRWVALVLLLIISAIAWKKLKNRNKLHYAPRSEPPLLLLLRSLEAQSPKSPFPEGVHSDYFFTLSMAFRQILEQAYSFPATDLTLKELHKPLKDTVNFEGYSSDEMLKFFERCDLIKFAKSPTSENEAKDFHNQALNWAKKIVERNAQQQKLENTGKPLSASSSQ